jgi:hypothetical protein
MRITKESLLRVARENVNQRIHSRPDLVAAYLTGSLLKDEPLLGNTTDIDLVFVHPFQPSARREIVALTPEIHLDIKYNPRSEYEPPRELRLNPWLGPEMYDPICLYDGQHFLDFVQAGVREKYHDPVNAHGRATLNAQHARRIWGDLQVKQDDNPKSMLLYLKSVNHAANAIAVIKDSPLSERRFLLEFPGCADTAGNAGMVKDLYDLLGSGQADKNSLEAFLPSWEKDFLEAGKSPSADLRLHPARLAYYRQGFEALLAGEKPLSVLWPLVHTWSLAAKALPESECASWTACCQQLGLLQAGLDFRLQKLDQFLDEVEKILDNMALSNGLTDIEDMNY